MKAFISILMVLTYSFIFAAEPGKAPAKQDWNKEYTKEEKDWNKIFKQPTSNLSLSQPPEATQLIEPGFMSQVKGTEVTLKWKEIPGVKYHLQVATDPMYKWLVVDQLLVSYTEYSVKNLQPGTQYFWRVYTQHPGNMPGHMTGNSVGSEFETAAQ